MKSNNIQMRDAFIGDLYESAILDSNIILVSNEQGAVSLDQLRQNLPQQFINAGISEQNIISVAAGLALCGKNVFVYSIASFITLRCYEQIKLDLCSMKVPVTIVGVGTCYSYSTDGPSHHATEDISIMRALPNMSIFSPADSNTTAALVDIALQSQNPVYIRLDREKLPTLYRKNKINYSQGISTHYKGDDICIISTGLMVHRAIEVADSLRSYSIHAKVIDVYRLKPLNIDAIKVAIVKSKKIITIEEHTINGGLGSMIAEMLADLAINIPLKRLAIEDKFLCAYGVRENLHRERGLDTESIVEFIIKWLQ